MTDSDGHIVWEMEYSAFGEELRQNEQVYAQDVSGVRNNIRFGGKPFEEIINLYYFNARWYDASLGRFISEDPIQDGGNWYVYGNNSPLMFVDPTGLLSLEGANAHSLPGQMVQESDLITKSISPDIMQTELTNSFSDLFSFNNDQKRAFNWLYENKYFNNMKPDTDGIAEIVKLVFITSFLDSIGTIYLDSYRDYHGKKNILWKPTDSRHPFSKMLSGTPRYRIDLSSSKVEHEFLEVSTFALPMPISIDLSGLLVSSYFSSKIVNDLGGAKQNISISNLQGILINLSSSFKNQANQQLNTSSNHNSSSSNGGDDNKPKEPRLPGKRIVQQNGVTVEHYYHGNDHGNPTHLHVKGGGTSTKIGPQGLPTKGQSPLSAKQAKVVNNNLSTIKRSIKLIQKWLRFNNTWR